MSADPPAADPPRQLPGPREVPPGRFADGAPGVRPRRAGTPGRVLAAGIIGAALGGPLAGAAYLAIVVRAEAGRPPAAVEVSEMSYGQQAGLVSLPLTALWGAAACGGAGLFLAGTRRAGAAVQIAAAVGGSLLFAGMLADDIRANGPDFSRTVLYRLPLTMGLTVGGAAGLLSLASAIVSARRSRN